MILSTHSVVGAGVAYAITGNPFVAFLVGFTSHFILDAMPHWEYSFSEKFRNLDFKSKNFWVDGIKISLDFFVGFILVLLFLQGSFSINYVIWAGFLGGVLPDAIQFIGFNPKLKPFFWFRKIHTKI